MFPRVSAVLPFRPLSRLPLCSAGPEASAATVVPLASPHGTVRTKCNIQRYFGTNSVIYSKKDDKSVPACEISKETENQGSTKENKKKDLVNIIKGMKVELSTVNVQTTKPPNRGQLKSLEAAIRRLQKSPEDAPQKSKSLSPELVAAATAVADSLPFDKQTTKSELLRQLRQHEEDSKAQKDGEKPKISFSNIISDMKVARSSTARASTRPVHQIQFDEGADDFVDREETADLRKRFRKNIFKGKRLNIFELKPVTEEAPETEAAPSLWDVEFAKQLAAVTEQPFQNGFEEMIQWTKEGKLWEFPINNEAGHCRALSGVPCAMNISHPDLLKDWGYVGFCHLHEVLCSRPSILRGPKRNLRLPNWFSGKESACKAGDAGLIPGSGGLPAEGNDNPLQCFCLKNPTDRGACWATVHGVAESYMNTTAKKRNLTNVSKLGKTNIFY